MSDAETEVDLQSFDWNGLVQAAAKRTCEAYWSTIHAWLGRTDISEDTRRVWGIVARLVTPRIHLDPDAAEPFVGTNEQLDKSTLALAVKALPAIADAELRARVIDLAWLKRACPYDVAKQAVDAYVESADRLFDPMDWTEPYARLKRAIELGAALGRQTEFQTAVAAIERTIDRVGTDDPLFFVQRLMKLLLAYKVGEPAKLGLLSQDLASRARSNYELNGVGDSGQCEREHAYLELVQAWAKRNGDAGAAHQAALEIADAFIRRAEGILVAKWPSSSAVAAHFIGEAIEQLRRVGDQEAKITALRHRMEQLQRSAMEELAAMPMEADFTEQATRAREHVTGKPAVEALFALAFGYNPPLRTAMEDDVRKSGTDTPLSSLLPAAYLGPRGTTLVSHGAVPDDPFGFEAQVMRAAHERQQLIAVGFIWPAAQQIMREHGLEIAFFIALAARSPFVPAGREHNFGRGLAAGANGDFEVAAHLLFPQLDHAIRELFFVRGVVTTTLPASGHQNELDLNKLLVHDAAPKVFGDDETFDLRVLLIEKAGANLRNNLAHGIVADGASIGAKIYLWWVCLRLACFPFIQNASVK